MNRLLCDVHSYNLFVDSLAFVSRRNILNKKWLLQFEATINLLCGRNSQSHFYYRSVLNDGATFCQFNGFVIIVCADQE